MAETMTALVERHRAFLAALTDGCKTDWSREVEAAFYATADTEAGDIIETDPPRLLDHADLVAAIRYVADDVDFLQKGHARVLARALEYLNAPAAEPEPDPLLALIGAYRAGVEIQNAIPDDEWDERAGTVEAEHIKPHHARLETDPPAATSLAGVMAALQLVTDENDIGDTPDLTAAVSRAALAYFNPEATTVGRLKAAMQNLPSLDLVHVQRVAEILAAGGDPSEAIGDALPPEQAEPIIAQWRANHAG